MKISKALILLLVLSQCACTSILYAPFTGENLGALPNKNLPGNPVGDALIYNASIENRLEISGFNGRSLQISNAAPMGSPSYTSTWTTFQGKNTSQVNGDFVFSWIGMNDFSFNSGNDFHIDLSIVNSNTRIRLIITDGGALYYTTDLLNRIYITSLFSNVRYGITVRAKPKTETFDLLVSRFTSSSVEEYYDLDFINQGSGIGNFANPAIAFNYANGDYHPDRHYVFDQLRIERVDNDNNSTRDFAAALPLAFAAFQRIFNKEKNRQNQN